MGKVYVVGIHLVWGGVSVTSEELDNLRIRYGQSIASSIGYSPIYPRRDDAEVVQGDLFRLTGAEPPIFELETFEDRLVTPDPDP